MKATNIVTLPITANHTTTNIAPNAIDVGDAIPFIPFYKAVQKVSQQQFNMLLERSNGLSASSG